jgi:hypothetical protein
MVETVSVRMPEDLAGMLDDFVRDLQRRMGDEVVVVRSDAVRILVSRSLRRWRSRSRPARR